MSIVVEVRFPAERLPSPWQAWQKSIEAHNFAVEIDSDFDPLKHTGFLPARYGGQAAGFEYYCDLETDEQCCVMLRWSGRAREAVSGLIAAACLCHLTTGHLVDTEEGETIEATSVIAWARQCEADLQQLLERQDLKLAAGAQTPRPSWWRFWVSGASANLPIDLPQRCTIEIGRSRLSNPRRHNLSWMCPGRKK